ncbi:MAG: ATP-dependent Clp protease proteolytic subunit [Caulobacteraceae bacterium]|nr:ATP-dependent Clp protease proteolytic subunit [Caulobacteraceae bacterium]
MGRRKTMGRKVLESKSESKKNSEEMLQIATVSNPSDSSRLVVLHGDVNESSISMVVAQMLHLASINHKPIHLVISTYGGSVDEMFTLYDTIKFLPCPVHTIALGKVMSAGVLLLASGTKGRRMIGKNARVMIHPVSGGAGGNVFEVMAESKEHKRLQDQMVDAIVGETRSTREQIEKIMKRGHDVYLLPEEAIKMGIVDKIIGV